MGLFSVGAHGHGPVYNIGPCLRVSVIIMWGWSESSLLSGSVIAYADLHCPPILTFMS